MSESTTPGLRFGAAVRWATVMSWGQDGLSALTTFVLALLLGPGDFGLVVVALSITGVIELFVSQGFLGAIVQREKVEEIDLDSIFWVTVALGVVVTTGAVAASGALASFYGLPRLAPVIQALSLCVLIKGLTVVQEAKLTREMDFKNLALRTNLSVIVGAAVGVSLALAGWGAWALVWQSLARGLTGLVVLWRAARWTPRLRFHAGHTGEMTVFSLKYFPATMFDFLGTQAEPLIMGKFFGEAAVGVYRLAMRLLDLVITIVTRALWYVSFPYFSEAQGDTERLRTRVRDCLRYSMLFSLPVLAILALESHALVELLGPKWTGAAKTIQILCVYASLRSLILFAGPLLVALGRPQVFSAIMGVQCAALGIGVAIAGYLLGQADPDAQVAGIAWARVVVYVAIFLPFAVWVIVRNAKLSVGELAACVVPGIAVALAAGGVEVLLMTMDRFVHVPPIAGLIIRGGVAGVAALLVMVAIDPALRRAVVALFQPGSRIAESSSDPGTSAP